MRNVELYLEDSLLPGDAGYKEPLYLSPEFGYVPQNLNLGFPEVRDVVSKRPSANGVFDYTSFFGAKSVSISIGIANELYRGSDSVDDQILEDRLRSWMLPSVRAFLYYRFSSTGTWRRVAIRGSAVNSGLNFVRSGFRNVTLGWKAPEGLNEAATITSVVLSPFASVEEGRSYDLLFDRTYPASSPVGSSPIDNIGNAPVLPDVLIYGPVTQPRIENVTTGKTIEFDPAFEIEAGDYLAISFRDGTVALNGDQSNSRYSFLDFSESDWWEIVPGVNNLRFYPLVQSAPAQAVVSFYAKYI